jgi:DNA-binding XRE family transcriptional regulator
MKTHKNAGRLVAQIRNIIGKSQSQFAALVGVSKHTIISVENGRNQLTKKLTRRIQLATGAIISDGHIRFEPVFDAPASKPRNTLTPEALKFIRRRHDGTGTNDHLYTREDFEQWRENFYPSTDETARRVFDQIKMWVEFIFRAAAKPGVTGNRDRLPAVHQSLVEWLNETLENFKLFNEVDAILEEETHEIGEHAYSMTSLKDPKNRERLKKEFAEGGYDFDELKKHFKKASPGDMMILETERRRVWYPFNGSESIPCKDWKLLKGPKFRFEFGYDYLARIMNTTVSGILNNEPELIAKVEILRQKSTKKAARRKKLRPKS